jgi:hypothetical protein
MAVVDDVVTGTLRVTARGGRALNAHAIPSGRTVERGIAVVARR